MKSKREWHYFMDEEGLLYHEGVELEDPELHRFFLKNMTILENGQYYVRCQGEDCYIEAQDVPYVVQSLEETENQILLNFMGGYQEPLDLSTLEVGKNNILYCRIQNQTQKARFNRKTYWEITKRIEEDPVSKKYYFVFHQQRYLIQI
ncbi:MAG: DUF1285 domain-containing protein [Deltaproteobacteria bacterium]|nr:DUF1285 domain-containing protein [Deltaproteobacteria bacterium]